MEIPRFLAWIAMDSWKKLQKKDAEKNSA